MKTGSNSLGVVSEPEFFLDHYDLRFTLILAARDLLSTLKTFHSST